jgi:hypothetical protein
MNPRSRRKIVKIKIRINLNTFQLGNGTAEKLLTYYEHHWKKVEQMNVNIGCYTALRISQ